MNIHDEDSYDSYAPTLGKIFIELVHVCPRIHFWPLTAAAVLGRYHAVTSLVVYLLTCAPGLKNCPKGVKTGAEGTGLGANDSYG